MASRGHRKGRHSGPKTADPAVAYEYITETYSIDDRNDLEAFLDAAEDASSVLDMQRELREPRTAIKAALSRLGLSQTFHAFPPVDLDDRLETLRDGSIPAPDTDTDMGGDRP